MILRETSFVLQALLARAARARGDAEAYRAASLRALRRLAPGVAGDRGSRICDCEAIMGSRGGFFAAIAITDEGARAFVKCVARKGPEAQFWARFARGGIVGGGKHFHITPPRRAVGAGPLAVLVFDEDARLAAPRPRRQRQYQRRTADVIRCIADLNSSNMLARDGNATGAATHRIRRAPSARKVARLLGTERADAERIVRALREIDRDWPRVRDRLVAAPMCLSHMDLGPGNVTLGADVAEIHDFGHVAAAPVGSDLHTVCRYAPKFDRMKMIDTYLEVFADKGITLDPQAVGLAADAQFAARYRNPSLPSARRREVIDEAIATSRRLLAQVQR